MKRRSAPPYGPYGSGRTLRLFLYIEMLKYEVYGVRLRYRFEYNLIDSYAFYCVIAHDESGPVTIHSASATGRER